MSLVGPWKTVLLESGAEASTTKIGWPFLEGDEVWVSFWRLSLGVPFWGGTFWEVSVRRVCRRPSIARRRPWNGLHRPWSDRRRPSIGWRRPWSDRLHRRRSAWGWNAESVIAPDSSWWHRPLIAKNVWRVRTTSVVVATIASVDAAWPGSGWLDSAAAAAEC